jgi:hypothetical protein
MHYCCIASQNWADQGVKFERQELAVHSCLGLEVSGLCHKLAMEAVPVKYVIADLDGTLLDTGM